MEALYLAPTEFTPEISFSPAGNTFILRGNSRPEDVRELFDPVIRWLSDYRQYILSSDIKLYPADNPLILEFDLDYFNSSSAKFLYDIMMIIKQYRETGINVNIVWHYDEDDIDMKEAGEDLGLLAETELIYIKKQGDR